MRAINIKKNQMSTSMNKSMTKVIDLSDRQPCWYANLECKSDKSKSKWTVGVKVPGEDKDEFSFKVSSAGDANDEKFWLHVSSAEFAIELINQFKIGGKTAVDGWVKGGCQVNA
jgi:hypothetical protein